MTKPWHVLTGGPGSGKTTSIQDLSQRGYPVQIEIEREMFEERFALGHTISDIDFAEFERTALERHLEEEKVFPDGKTIFLDRGTADIRAYCRFFNIAEPDGLAEALSVLPYKKIFILDLVNVAADGVRHESLAEAQKLHALIGEVYRELGCDIVRVPVMPVAERSDFILANL
jgi:predicted ATPase